MRPLVRRTRLVYLLALAIVVVAPWRDASAWGAKGHRIVGHVARELLSSEARASIRQIMGSDDLATMALHMDQHKNELDQRIPGSRDWHYDDIPVCERQSHAEYCPQGNCASTQTERHRRILIDAHASTREKQFAIFVLTHVVGDVHQPLHAADNDDRGGNGIKVRLPGPNGKKTSLHSAWDTDFVEAVFGGKNEVMVAQGLVKKFAGEAAEWRKGRIGKWIGESHEIAKEVVYGGLPNFACGTDLEGRRIPLTEEYVERARAIVETQLAKAGYRLAEMLDRVFRD